MFSSVIFPIVLYCSKTWSVTLKEDHKLQVSENKETMKIFIPKEERCKWE
jgi:hypothetical protein